MPDYKTQLSLAKPQNCALLVIDVQEKLINTIANAGAVIANITALIKTAQLFQVPIVVTEQEKLGPTVPVLKELLQTYQAYNPISKQSFSCCRNGPFSQALEKTHRKHLLITGIEAHICVSQTALDLLANDYLVQIIADATSSHSPQDHQAAIDRLASAGATITTTEALIYELTASAQTPLFKQILAIVKDRRNSFDQ
ncbi:MAG: hydrolase [Phycisphaerae bacterium]|nr:hydrolase [Phycisphaerae bacterium]